MVSLKLAASGSYLKSESATPSDPLNIGYPKFNDSGQATADKFNNFHDGLVIGLAADCGGEICNPDTDDLLFISTFG